MNQRTELESVGEFGLIQKLSEPFRNLTRPESVRGIGDDAAVLDPGGPDFWLVSTDMLLEGIHFDLTYAPLRHLGYKAVAVNVSDIAAMNGFPTQVTVSIGVSNRFSVEAVEELYAGVRAACDAYAIDLIGGDTTSSRSGLVISVTAIGRVAKDRVAYRNTAKPSDVICVTGDLGAAFLGLQLLEREKQVFLSDPNMQPDIPQEKSYLLQRQLRPNARTDMVFELRDLDVVPTAMIDVSDGLASDLLHLCNQSGTGAVLFDENIPVDDITHLTATELNISPMTAALNGGEDYELLFTVRPQAFEKLKNNAHITAIGYMTDDPQQTVLATKAGQQTPLRAQGWKSF